MNWTVRNNFRHVRRRFTEEKSEKSDSARARTSPLEGAGWLKPFPPSKTSKFESFVMNKKSTGGGGGGNVGRSVNVFDATGFTSHETRCPALPLLLFFFVCSTFQFGRRRGNIHTQRHVCYFSNPKKIKLNFKENWNQPTLSFQRQSSSRWRLNVAQSRPSIGQFVHYFPCFPHNCST